MSYVLGFVVWTLIGLAAATVIRTVARGPETSTFINILFGLFGAFVGGMLGVSGYVFHNPSPMRFGGLLGAVIGAFFFTYLYQYMARKAV
jgi:uncharacterized membrane protein YeaQ/YmgE (transglycosylase-associated protein family)